MDRRFFNREGHTKRKEAHKTEVNVRKGREVRCKEGKKGETRMTRLKERTPNDKGR